MYNFWTTFLLFSAMCSCIYAINEAELLLQTMKMVFVCNKDGLVDVSELLQLQNLVVPTRLETKCLLACTYKTAGLMNKDGMYDSEWAYKIAEEMKDGDEKRVENARKIVEICEKVNEVNVTDGEKGCERAGLIFKCTIETAPKFGFKLA